MKLSELNNIIIIHGHKKLSKSWRVTKTDLRCPRCSSMLNHYGSGSYLRCDNRHKFSYYKYLKEMHIIYADYLKIVNSARCNF